MFDRSAEFYDRLYRWKDYAAEAEAVAAALGPQIRDVLDVACGTGEHHRHLAERYRIDGTDLNETFLTAARGKNPHGAYYCADMTDFDLGRQYDAVICMFSSIGYAHEPRLLEGALRSMGRHLKPMGTLLIEPWFPPSEFHPGRPHMLTVDEEGLKVCRMSHSIVEGTCSLLHFHYMVGTPDGVESTVETHRLGLYTVAEMLAAFQAAGLSATYESPGPGGRGLYRAVASR